MWELVCCLIGDLHQSNIISVATIITVVLIIDIIIVMVNDYHKDHHHVDHCPAARTVVSVMMMRCKPGRGFSLSLFPLSLSLAAARTVVSVMIVRSRLVRRLPPTPTTMILSTVILIKIMMTRMMLMMVMMMFRMVIMIMRIVMTIALNVTVLDYVRNLSF